MTREFAQKIRARGASL